MLERKMAGRFKLMARRFETTPIRTSGSGSRLLPSRILSFQPDSVSIVYRARCFSDAAEAARFREMPDDKTMTLDGILSKLTAEMIRRGVVSSSQVGQMSSLELAMKLLDVFVHYPLPQSAFVPYNYCALS